MCSVFLPAEGRTVSIAADQPTPMPGYLPMTPGSHSNSPFTPQMLGASLDISGQSPNIEVTIEDTHEDPGLQGQSGIIRGVTSGIHNVFKCLKPAEKKYTGHDFTNFSKQVLPVTYSPEICLRKDTIIGCFDHR